MRTIINVYLTVVPGEKTFDASPKGIFHIVSLQNSSAFIQLVKTISEKDPFMNGHQSNE